MSADERSGPEPPSEPDAAGGAGGGTSVGPGGSATEDAGEPDSQALRVVSEEVAREYPPLLERTTLLLYDLDPKHLQVQWNLCADDFARARAVFPRNGSDLRQVLRLCRQNPDGRSELVDRAQSALGADELQGQEQFALEGDGATFECELGLESADGGWLLLARSNAVQLGAASGDRRPTAAHASKHGSELQEAQDRARNPSEPVEPLDLTLVDTGERLEPVFPIPASARALSDGRPSQRLAGRPSRAGGPRRATAARTAAVPETAGGRDLTEGAWEKTGPIPPTAAVEAPDSPDQPSDPASSWYDPRNALSSAALGSAATNLAETSVNVELHIHGCARPGALVQVFGLSLRAGADGRFFYSHAIDDSLLLKQAFGGRTGPEPRDTDPE
jgi:hypothetical protein